jgi:anaerobic magnesium-protoporphyrin IX monomethyl ester cyclase
MMICSDIKEDFLKILLINPKISFDLARTPTCPLGLLSIASYLINKGHSVKIFDNMVESANIKKFIKTYNPDVVGFSVISPMASADAVRISRFVKTLEKPVVWGGHITSALPELVFKEGCVDFIVIGEGEITFSELLDTMENGGAYSDIDGLAFLDKDGVHINKYREFADLSTFPVIDWSLVQPQKYLQYFFGCKRMIYVYFSKGCPGKCTFCNNPTFHRSTHRTRPPEHLIDEIEYLIKNCGIDSVNFADEYWHPVKEDRQRFYDLIKERKLNFVWGIQTRLGSLNREDLQKMYDAGCRWVLFGIESGCGERVVKIKKGTDLSKAKEAFQICREIGITTQSSFIIGFPDETEEELKESVRFGLDLKANLCPFSMLFLYPGSEMYDYAVNNGLYVPPKSLKEWRKVVWLEDLNINLSKVPLIELKVIHYYTQWSAFTDKGSINSDSYGIAKKMITDAFIKIFRNGFISFFAGSYASAKWFLTVFWYAKAYPGILKKYGLHKRI